MISPNHITSKRRWPVLAAATVLLTACAVKVPLLDADWPDDEEIPPRGWFLARYVSDTTNQQHQRPNEYLRWVVRFYYGWINHPNGWLDITERALAATGKGVDSELARRMTLLGRRMAAEWAKTSPDRLIDNRAIAVWSKALSIAADTAAIDETILSVAGDVDALFSGALTPAEISMVRYFPGQAEPPSFERF